MATMTLDEVRDLAVRVLSDNGCDAANAAAIARTLQAAEGDHAHSHGLFRLPAYVKGLREAGANGAADPRPERALPGMLTMDAQGGYAPLALERAVPALAGAAREAGIAMCGIRRVRHFAALWPEVEALAAEGLVGLAMTQALPYVAPAGGREALFGTNPLAFAWPREDGPPLAFDMATSRLARGEIMIAARDGHAVPEDAGLDAEGRPTTDAGAILKGGVQLPFGGYKGSAIALMVELMASSLIGERTSVEAKEGAVPGTPALGGELLIAIDPQASAGDGWRAHAQGLLATIEGMEGARLPGARRHANRAKGGDVEVSDKVLAEIEAL